MANCTSHPDYLLSAAEANLSPRAFDDLCSELFWYAPNPFKEGRDYHKDVWRRDFARHARSLIWC